MRDLKTRREATVLSIAGIEGEVQGSRTIDVRIADGDRFLLYGPSALTHLESVEVSGELILDFAINFRYSHMKEGRRVFLYSDRFLTRLTIIDGKFQLQIFHRAGLGRTNPVQVAAIIESRLVETMRKRNLEPRIEILQEQA
jgi:hypothetical protein